MKVFITGGVGYIGSAVSKYLIDNSIATEVTLYDNLSSPTHGMLLNHKYVNTKIVKGDILDSRSLKKAMTGHDAVIHLAETSDDKNGHAQEQVNHWGTAEVCYAIEALGIKNFLYLSTTKVYPYTASDEIINSTDNTAPTSAYASSKKRGEEHVERFINKAGFNTHILRVASVYGYAPSVSFESFLNKQIFNAQFVGRLELFGTGFQYRSFVHIDNVVSVIAAMVSQKIASGIYNLADKTLSVIDSIDALKDNYPDMEFIFASHHLTLPHIRVNTSEQLTPFVSNTKELSEQIADFKNKFSF